MTIYNLMRFTEEDCGPFMFPDLRDNSDDFSVVERLSISDCRSLKIRSVTFLIVERCKHSKQPVYISRKPGYIAYRRMACRNMSPLQH